MRKILIAEDNTELNDMMRNYLIRRDTLCIRRSTARRRWNTPAACSPISSCWTS